MDDPRLPRRPDLLRGLTSLAHDAVDQVLDLVREGHGSAHRNVVRAAELLEGAGGPASQVSRAVLLGTEASLATAKAVNLAARSMIRAAMDAAPLPEPAPGPPLPLRSDAVGTPEWVTDAALASVNAAIGHHLAATGNPLDLGLRLRLEDRYLDPTRPEPLEGEVVVLVHGLGTTEWCWALDAEALHGDPSATFGSMLRRDRGSIPIFARYNTGRSVAENGAALADALEATLGGPGVRRVVLVGHSMGGLVSRAACHAGRASGHRWVDRLDLVVSLGTPHRGAPLARLGDRLASGLDAVDLPATRVLARVLEGRSAGIRDLEHGDAGDLAPDPDATAEPEARRVPLVDGVTYAFLGATVTRDPEHPVGRWLGDLLVRAGSAAGPPVQSSFPVVTGTFGGLLHQQLQVHPSVYERLLELVGPAR